MQPLLKDSGVSDKDHKAINKSYFLRKSILLVSENKTTPFYISWICSDVTVLEN
jgi:hypothetical protein